MPFFSKHPAPVSFHRHDVGREEERALRRVLKSGWINTGPETAAFEKELGAFTGSKEVVCLSSATAGLFLALRAAGIGPGDDVVVPVYTYSATAAAVLHAGARPIPADVDALGLLCPETLAAALTPQTRAVIAVDLGGLPCDYPALGQVISRAKKKWVINPGDGDSFPGKWGRPLLLADAAHSLGARDGDHPVGTLADMTVFSFHAVKNITTGDGGAVAFGTGEDDVAPLAKTIRLWALHGQTMSALEKMQPGRWAYDIAVPGYKFNLTDIASALGRAQLKRIGEMETAKNRVALTYDRAFAGHPVVNPQPRTAGNRLAAPHLYRVQMKGMGRDERDAIIKLAASAGISLNVHYRPLPHLTAWAALGWKPSHFPQAEALWQNEISLPLYPSLKDKDIKRVIACFSGY